MMGTARVCFVLATPVIRWGLQDSGIGAADFADRLSLILANLEQSERLHRQANFDSLTGLQNRHLFADRVRAAVAAAEQRQGQGSLLYLDLDHFKRVNDTAGHNRRRWAVADRWVSGYQNALVTVKASRGSEGTSLRCCCLA